ncbi:Fanconi anemia group J protein homolog isoform X2 [Salvia splendens]|uniref:Fanconi anemia group J protein homolog isoform X2 n=1 Tax=Salvia splendens TaxID=180675 RepID=UPI001C27E6DB|nr:Fanconi anemia group J protein homolog isoform X2 [Salvia splendens]
MVKVHFLPSDDCSRPVLDIEDSVNVGLRVKGCSYFASRAMVEEAELIFCPYDYIINPAIREGHKINLPGSVIILDEAHNIDDVARECGSIDLEEEYLLELKTDLAQLSMIDDMTYRPLLEMTKGILGWIDRRKNTLGSDVKCRCWTGDEALKELEDASISLQNFGNLQDCAKKAIKAATEVKSDMHRLRRKGFSLRYAISSLRFTALISHCNELRRKLKMFGLRPTHSACGA